MTEIQARRTQLDQLTVEAVDLDRRGGKLKLEQRRKRLCMHTDESAEILHQTNEQNVLSDQSCCRRRWSADLFVPLQPEDCQNTANAGGLTMAHAEIRFQSLGTAGGAGW